MNNKEILKYIVNLDLKKNFYKHGIDKLLQEKVFKPSPVPKPMETFNAVGGSPFEPDHSDLTRLYSIIRKRKIITVLEFGSGKSTLIMGEALKKNNHDYSKKISLIRRKNPFHIFSLESEKKYARIVKNDCKKMKLEKYATIKLVNAEQTLFNNMICGRYKKIPSVCPDLIYIDGPMPSSYKNSKNQYLDMNEPEITNITCDLLMIEPILLPGTIVIIDGLTNNARFNLRNLKRTWLSHQDLKKDYTVMILDEPILGIHHKNQLLFQNSN
jgi:predicted O-methyltransferase YrrM